MDDFQKTQIFYYYLVVNIESFIYEYCMVVTMVWRKTLIQSLKVNIVILYFVLGFFIGLAMDNGTASGETPMQLGGLSNVFSSGSQTAPEVPSPEDYIQEQEIHVLRDKVIIDIANAQWAKFTDTNSMDPVLDYGTNAIEIVPTSPTEIHVGDIISYKSTKVDSTIIHRVIEKGIDKDGYYFILKGDNNKQADPEKVRFPQIRRKVIALIY